SREELLPVLKKPPSSRDEPGEFGHPFIIPHRMGASVERQVEEGYRRHAFNVLVSDVISVHRNLGDKREDVCKTQDKQYTRPLPTMSVVICYKNEAFSTLIRTLYSVLESVPAVLLKEVILIDDFSGNDFTEAVMKEIEELSLVKLSRNTEHLGIVKSRIKGAKMAAGDVIAFLDSHCECYEGWAEPLLDRISRDRTVVALPVMEIINPDNFKFTMTPMQRIQRGGFDWTLTYRWIPPHRDRFLNPTMDMTQPVTSPTMSGGVFAIERKFFNEMGSYDDGMSVWGGDNLEMSFRIWMCGGRIEILPCNHVGHVRPHDVHNDVVLRNKRRVADVWLDDYISLFFKRTPGALKADSGNITSRVQLRHNLNCKSFSWFIEQVYPELYVPELHPRLSGAVCCRLGETLDICLDTHSDDVIPGRPLGVDRYRSRQRTQYFEFTKHNELRHNSVRDVCVGVTSSHKVEIQRCKFPFDNHETAPPSQQWEISESGKITNKETQLCLTASTAKVWVQDCDVTNVRQKWKWK
uniref:Polypeptide N-acetylgalactosaminyltransferase n=1 Tax=Ciona intestinalis TaxID=7719 RepID=F6VV46_CIOIN